jgi:long-chain acyl-CoA synthetase
MALEFYNHILDHSYKAPDHPAIIDGESTISYKELVEQIDDFSKALEGLQLNKNSKLGLLCLNQKEFLIALLGAFRIGLPVIPLNALLNGETLAFIIKDAEIDNLLLNPIFIKEETAVFFISFNNVILTSVSPQNKLLKDNAVIFEDFLNSGKESTAPIKFHERPDNIPDVILYTSGTTDRPKGVSINEKQFYLNTGAFLDRLNLTSNDKGIVALPLFHSFGNIMALTLFRVGATLIMLPQFAPKTILILIEKCQATLLPLVPTIYSFLLDIYAKGNYNISSLRLCISGGASLPEVLLHQVEDILGVTVIEGYGLTETSPVLSVNSVSEGSVPGSVGKPLANVKLKIIDESGASVSQEKIGEILVKGPTIMGSYWKRPDETKLAFDEEGWFRTGDLGHLDKDNRLYISAGRKKDLIIRAGENVSPLVIENRLIQHPQVTEAAAVGIPHDRLGEKIKACVVLRENSEVTETSIKSFCKETLPAYMTPDIVQFYEALPKNPTGKVLKNLLREN